MFRFFKNILNTVIIVFAIIGFFSLCKNNVFDSISSINIFSMNKEKIEKEVGDFSNIDKEFKVDKAVKVLGYKTVVAKHQTTGQKMIVVDSGKKTLLTEEDITGSGVKDKLELLSQKLNSHSKSIEDIEIVEKGYMTTYGKRVPYVKFNAKLSRFPKTNISGIVSVVDSDKNNQKLIVSINDRKHYSQLITSEFYRNIK